MSLVGELDPFRNLRAVEGALVPFHHVGVCMFFPPPHCVAVEPPAASQ